MSFAPLYLLNRFFFRVSDFFHHWYGDGSRVFRKRFLAFRDKPILMVMLGIPLAVAYLIWITIPFFVLFMVYKNVAL